ncbi:NfeD family protein [Solirubrobacter soli]|uniref:NfeD family protein n=1 Tax=Solirubrobacter soli TaxID=363832 RepID=UPI0004192892|nr:NfeD family protein [Solirubrobacter soli]
MFALGLLLVLLGAILVALEAHVSSHGVLGSGAIAALAVGIALLLTAGGSTVLVAVFGGLTVALTGGAWVSVVARKALGTRRLRERNSLVGRMGVARSADSVFVDGALWHARQWDLEGEAPFAPGDHVVVEHVNGLTLTVRPAEEWEV